MIFGLLSLSVGTTLAYNTVICIRWFQMASDILTDQTERFMSPRDSISPETDLDIAGVGGGGGGRGGGGGGGGGGGRGAGSLDTTTGGATIISASSQLVDTVTPLRPFHVIEIDGLVWDFHCGVSRCVYCRIVGVFNATVWVCSLLGLWVCSLLGYGFVN